MNQHGSVAIVTGASGGLAPGIVTALTAAGMTVIATARRQDRLEQLAACDAGQVVASASDATDAASVRFLAEMVIDRFGRIDVLVNAAASSTPISGQIEDVDVDALIADVDTKVGGYLRYTQAVVPAMKTQRAGHIINIGGLTGRSSDTLSGLRNAAVSHLTKVLSDQLGPSGIAVNAVHPGIVETPHLAELFDEMAAQRGVSAKDVRAEFVSEIPGRTLLTPADIGSVVAYMVQQPAHLINGQSITVDGGYSRGIFL